MPIITISRGAYSSGMEIAERVAMKLGYQCFAREVIIKASEEFNIPEIKLLRAIHDAPSVLDRFTYGKEKFIAYFQSALLKRVQADNVVYHGLAGHFFLKGISHVIKVRIIADMEDRIGPKMAKENISADEARSRLKKDDEERRKWSQHLYGIDTADPLLYDLVIHIDRISVEDAVDLICYTASLETYQTTPESQRVVEDLVLASEVKTTLLAVKPDVQVFVRDGIVVIGASSVMIKDPKLRVELERMAGRIPGVREVLVKSTSLVDWSGPK